jgi:two-component system chemotaxis sensor kinase CheA
VPQLTLDDAATLLLQLEPGDLDDLARLRDALTTLVFENRVPITAQPHVARAARLLGTLVDRTATDADATFTDASRAVEAAMVASDAVAAAATLSVNAPAPATPVSEASAPVTPAPVASVPVAHAPVASAPVASPAVAHDPSLDELPDDTDLDLLGDFLTESADMLAAAEAALLELEADPSHEEAVNTVFRAFHTVKGTSAFLGLGRIAGFAHEAESLLSRVRDHEIAYTRACAELSLASSDMIKALLDAVKAAAAGNRQLRLPPGYDALFHALATYQPDQEPTSIADTLAAAVDAAATEAAAIVAVRREETGATAAGPNTGATAAGPNTGATAAGPNTGATAAGSTSGATTTPAEAARRAAHDATIRVRTDRLDRLIDMVGELVIAQSMIAGDSELDQRVQHELTRKITHAGKIVRELQDLSMSMRMIELRPTFQKLARVVRDTAVKAGKEVQFLVTGDEVEIDRQLADLLGDPLVHMVRNAVDHGVERPEERQQAGKSRTGTVRLQAYHASGNVVVELIDDGRGLHRDKIVAKAMEKGLIESDKGMSDSEVFNLIFAPGFSTAEKVTDISGRGVGMDVVRRNLEAIRGRIDISSAPGRGTTFAIRLPLTLAVTDGMLVRVGQERFVVPITNIHMSFRPEPSMLSTVVGKGEAVLLRGELMPIVRLHRLFDVADAVQSPMDGLLMIVGDAERRTALLVDELLGQQQVVAKTLGESLGKVPGITGGAILGDGRVGLILDVGETVALAQGGTGTLGFVAAERARASQAA